MATRISPQEALAAYTVVRTRGSTNVLALTLAALERAAADHTAELNLGSVEAAALAAHIRAAQIAVTSHASALEDERRRRYAAEKRADEAATKARSASAIARGLEMDRNNIRAHAGELDEKAAALKAEIEAWMARGAEFIGRLST